MNKRNDIRTKFAVGHFLTKEPDDPASFSELAKRFAPRLREVYFPWPGLWNARAKVYDKPDDEERIAADLKYCREHGMKLDLLANATCYGDTAFTEEQRLQVIGIIRHLDRMGLYPEIITTTSPFIAKVFKMNFPDIEVRASVNMRLRNTLALEYLAPLYDSYYICRDVQRDLPTFHAMAAWCRNHGKKLCMLANSGCVRNCPWQVFHETLLAHNFNKTFQEMNSENLELVCNQIFSKKRMRANFLRCTWIRPEDVHLFEPELETIKLSTREAKYPLEIAEAYLNGSYDGNLLRLMDPIHTFGFRPYRIDNKSFPADWATSGIAGKCADNCAHCGKCEQVLKQVLKYDINPDSRMDGFSLTNNFQLLAPSKRRNLSDMSVVQEKKGAQS
jgi:NAD-dependent dihydropyrimidine dehydrogenase PreA subunit